MNNRFRQKQRMALSAWVVDSVSFTAATRRAGLPKSSVRQREKSIGKHLLNRTTH